ncbi:MAG: hypothetical protein DHS20C01_30700 [marine bacterium B5-7]|nr:MAG: hypothetical protein DHS20C01_30700 [marine bacterium B5-7]
MNDGEGIASDAVTGGFDNRQADRRSECCVDGIATGLEHVNAGCDCQWL